jgi:molybdopterin synthase catalytic subunit
VFKIVEGPIEDIELEDAVRTDADGAVIVFRGVARRFSRGRDVVHLEYEAYPGMAESQMKAIAAEIGQRWPEAKVAIAHRTGVLEIGEASVVVSVSCPHRADAISACKWGIDRLKESVPVWKKEFFEGGEVWIEGDEPKPA